MIDKKMEPYYDILLSIFVAMMIILFLHNMYESPRILIIEQESENFKNTHQCKELSCG
jgi:p-aminobenzoyl-glutamate transporter AbgT